MEFVCEELKIMSKKMNAITMFYELSDILEFDCIVLAIKAKLPKKPIKIIIKDFTNLTITGYYEVLDSLLSMPYEELKKYEDSMVLNRAIAIVEQHYETGLKYLEIEELKITLGFYEQL